MTREDYIKVCSVCTNKSFNPKVGVTCGLTNEVANFKGTCQDFNEDTVAVRHEIMVSDSNRRQNRGVINLGRLALFAVGGIYILFGFLKVYLFAFGDLRYGMLDWIMAAVFIGLGIWSIKKAYLAMIIALGFYCASVLFLAVLNPVTLIQGFLWKILILALLTYGISTARAEEERRKKANSGNDDLLDQA